MYFGVSRVIRAPTDSESRSGFFLKKIFFCNVRSYSFALMGLFVFCILVRRASGFIVNRRSYKRDFSPSPLRQGIHFNIALLNKISTNSCWVNYFIYNCQIVSGALSGIVTGLVSL